MAWFNVMNVLADGRCRSVRDVRDAVEEQLGHAVSRHSVSWCLEKHAREPSDVFERVALGVYRLRAHS
jgi:hypothetical protein